MRLKPRLDALEAKLAPAFQRWVRIYRYKDQSQEQAVAAYEAEHGPLNDANIIMRVFIRKPFPVPHAAA